jgi:hypothetical protein
MVNGSTVVVFDDERAVANAGVMLPALLARRLGIEQLVDDWVGLGDGPGAANPGRKVMTMISAMALGADCIEDCDVLRSGRTSAVLGHRVAAPSTLGTFLRAFTFGHVRQLDRVLADSLRRAWAAGAGPGSERLVVDVDSFVGEVHGHDKQGAAFGYTHKRGYHPILATRAGTGEVLHIRARKGSANTARGARRFVQELIARRRDRAQAAARRLGVLEQEDHGQTAGRGLDLLDRRAPTDPHQGRDHGDPRDRLAAPGGLPRRRRGADRPDDDRPPTPRRASHPPRSVGRYRSGG